MKVPTNEKENIIEYLEDQKKALSFSLESLLPFLLQDFFFVLIWTTYNRI